MSEIPYQAAPLSRRDLRSYAGAVRQHLGLAEVVKLPIIEVLEHRLPRVMSEFVYDFASKAMMGNTHGIASPDRKHILIREDVYEGASDGNGRDRFTIAHEIGHLLLHQKDNLVLRRGDGRPPTFCDPEWQADVFAAEFLASWKHAVGCSTPLDMANRFGLSMSSAKVQFSQLRKERLI